MRLRCIALVLFVIAATVAGFVPTWVVSSRDAWPVFGTGLALAAVVEATRRVFEGETVGAFENRVLCEDGSYKWIEWTAMLVDVRLPMAEQDRKIEPVLSSPHEPESPTSTN